MATASARRVRMGGYSPGESMSTTGESRWGFEPVLLARDDLGSATIRATSCRVDCSELGVGLESSRLDGIS